jgi:hypothetical protein
VFGAIDKNHDGVITVGELSSIDRDGDGVITVAELRKATDEHAPSGDATIGPAADTVFGAIDKNHDGVITVGELSSIDRDGDGVITAAELRVATAGESAQVEEPLVPQPGTPRLPPLRQAVSTPKLPEAGTGTNVFSAQIAASWLAKRQLQKQNQQQQQQVEQAGGMQRIGVGR